MKIVIYVDYANSNFNKDFSFSNQLIAKGHNVFLAINDIQFEELKKNCDNAILGFSYSNSGYNDIARLDSLDLNTFDSMVKVYSYSELVTKTNNRIKSF